MLYYFHVKYIQNLLQMIYANGTRLCRRSGAGSPSIRARHISVGARWGVCSKIQRGSAEGRRRRKKRKKKKEKRKNKVKNRSEGRGKCINDLVAAGLTGLHGHGWRMVTVLPHAPKSLGYVTLSCGGVCWCAEVLRYASPKASGVRRYSRLKT